jgi:hypothetical protein
MNPASIIVLSEVAGAPKVKLDLPSLRLGDRLSLRFRVKRQHGGRSEVLDVDGEFRVRALSFEAGSTRQLLEVETTGKVPSWRAVRSAPEFKRVVPPAKSPRILVV